MFKVIFITKGNQSVHTIVEHFPSIEAAEAAARIYNDWDPSFLSTTAKLLFNPVTEKMKQEAEHKAWTNQ